MLWNLFNIQKFPLFHTRDRGLPVWYHEEGNGANLDRLQSHSRLDVPTDFHIAFSPLSLPTPMDSYLTGFVSNPIHGAFNRYKLKHLVSLD